MVGPDLLLNKIIFNFKFKTLEDSRLPTPILRICQGLPNRAVESESESNVMKSVISRGTRAGIGVTFVLVGQELALRSRS